MQKYILTLTYLLFVSVAPLFAWGQTGHRVIADIAYNSLTDKASAAVDSLLGRKGMVWWANWADQIKSDTIYPDSYDWHFQDLAPNLSDSAVISTLHCYPQHGGRLWQTLDSLRSLLADTIKPQGQNHIDALKFFIHLVGDAYCPMHIAHEDDLGGNRVKMKWFYTPTNLHRVWDENLIDSRGFSYSEYAEHLVARYSSELEEIEKAPFDSLLLQTYQLTQDIYDYQNLNDENTYHYIYRWHEACEKQLYKAGVRLAKWLNIFYK